MTDDDCISCNSRPVDFHAPHGTHGDHCENVSAGNALQAYDSGVWLPSTRMSAIGRRIDLDAVYVDELARRCRWRTEGR